MGLLKSRDAVRRAGRAVGATLVTGAGSGFGREFVRQLVEQGEEVALWDRDADGLDTTCAMAGCARAFRYVVDVRDGHAVREAAAKTRGEVGPIAAVIHCAGVLRVGPAEQVALDDYRQMLEVNALGSIHVSLAMVQHLREAANRGDQGDQGDQGGAGREGRRRFGAQKSRVSTLLLVSSVAGLRGFPQLAGYSASKHAVLGFAQALRDELAGQNVRVKVLCPPPGDTPMVRNLAKVPPIYRLSRLYSAEEIVGASLRSLDDPAWISMVDVGSKAMWRLSRWAPSLVDRIVQLAKQ
ncbi:MAG: SDR family oxidoreductase [Deltaproteobacteria bacterium]|nr:SDR family oxidoreductase [Deltaproteobacteria bacterium]